MFERSSAVPYSRIVGRTHLRKFDFVINFNTQTVQRSRNVQPDLRDPAYVIFSALFCYKYLDDSC